MTDWWNNGVIPVFQIGLVFLAFYLLLSPNKSQIKRWARIGPEDADVGVDVTRRRVFGVVLLLLLIFAVPISLNAAPQIAYIFASSNGLSLAPCNPPLNFLPCINPLGQNSTNICTNANVNSTSCPLPSSLCTVANIGTSSCQLPLNGCDGVYRVGIGRCEKGSGSCGINTGTCTSIITYPTTFTNAPFREVITTLCTGCGGLASVVTDSMSVIFAGATAQVWTSMPAAQTEIFGTTADEVIVDWTQINTVAFEVNCIVGSGAASPTLQLQWSTNGGVTWNNIAAAITIDNFAFCPGNNVLTTAYVTVPAAAQTGTTLLRVVGAGGAGVGDNPSFSKIVVLQTGPVAFKVIQQTFCVDNSPSATQLTTLKAGCYLIESGGSTPTANYNWQAWSYTG
jgi:hypothetical protein